jgi:hypothetical protein
MRTTTDVVAWLVLLACTGTTAAAQDIKVGFAVGSAVPVTGIALHEPALALSGWVSRSVGGPYGWRVEVGRFRLQMPDRDMFRCAAAGIFCDATLDVSSVGAGLHLEPWAEKAIAPYGYAVVGL